MISKDTILGFRSAFRRLSEEFLGSAAFLGPVEVIQSGLRSFRDRSYTVGTGGTFATLQQAVAFAKRRPANVPLRFVLLPGEQQISAAADLHGCPMIEIASSGSVASLTVSGTASFAAVDTSFVLATLRVASPPSALTPGQPVRISLSGGGTNAKGVLELVAGCHEVHSIDVANNTVSVKIPQNHPTLLADLQSAGLTGSLSGSIRYTQSWVRVPGTMTGVALTVKEAVLKLTGVPFTGSFTAANRLMDINGGGVVIADELWYCNFRSPYTPLAVNRGGVLKADAIVYSDCVGDGLVVSGGKILPMVHSTGYWQGTQPDVDIYACNCGGAGLHVGSEGNAALGDVEAHGCTQGVRVVDGASLVVTLGTVRALANRDGGITVERNANYEQRGGTISMRNFASYGFRASDNSTASIVASTVTIEAQGAVATGMRAVTQSEIHLTCPAPLVNGGSSTDYAAVVESKIYIQGTPVTGSKYSPAVNTVGNVNSLIRSASTGAIA